MALAGFVSSGSNPQKLEGREDRSGKKDSFRPREFFWDSITLYVVSAIIGLAAVDVLTEFIRGSSVACYAPSGEDISDSQEDYINNFCSGSVPRTEYFPVFIVVHAILIAIPHYLWLNHYGGNFDFFFKQASLLDRLRDEKTGDYSDKNRLIVQQLTLAFSTYKKNWMFILYVVKLVVQWLFTVAGLVVVAKVFTDFDETFYCPRNATTNEFWPLDTEVRCVFTSLRLLEVIHTADLILLVLLVICFTGSVFWCCIPIHSTQLGCKEVAKFVFESGMRPEHYVPNYLLSQCRCCKPCPKLFSNGCISTNLRFLVMKLFRTDSGLGFVFKELQVLQKVKYLNDDDQRRVNLHKRQQKDSLMADGGLIKSSEIRSDTKWNIVKKAGEISMFQRQGSKYKAFDPEAELTLPDSFRGIVMGLSAHAPKNESAIYITFGTPSLGVSSALARVFDRVGLVNFNPYYRGTDQEKSPFKTRTYLSNIIEIVCPEDSLSSDLKHDVKFLPTLKPIWVPEGFSANAREKKTDFIVVGPIDKALHCSTVSLCLAHLIPWKLEPGCVLLVIVPTEIAGKDIEDEDTFLDYNPPDRYFKSFKIKAARKLTKEAQDWPPKRPAPPPPAIASPPAPTQEGQQGHEMVDMTRLTRTPPTIEPKSSFDFRVMCGDSVSTVTFKLYKYKPPLPQYLQPQAATPET